MPAKITGSFSERKMLCGGVGAIDTALAIALAFEELMGLSSAPDLSGFL
jgi:hypothetical protein